MTELEQEDIHALKRVKSFCEQAHEMGMDIGDREPDPEDIDWLADRAKNEANSLKRILRKVQPNE